MSQLKAELLQRFKSASTMPGNGTRRLFGEFYLELNDPAHSWLSPALLEQLHFPHHAAGAENILNYISPADTVRLKQALAKGIENGQVQLQLGLKTGNATYQDALLQMEVVRSADSEEVDFCYGIALLIQNDLGRDSKPSKVTYREALLRAIPDMLFVFDEGLHFLDFKPGNGQDELMQDPEALIGRAAAEVLPDFLCAKLHKVIADIRQMGEGTAAPFEFCLDWESGTAYYTCTVSSLDEGTYVAVIHNITDSKRRDELLREVFERRRIFIEQAPNAIAMLDSDLRYLAVSNKWVEDYNLKGRNIIGEYHFDIFKNIDRKWKQIIPGALKGNHAKGDLEQYERSPGDTMYVKWEVRPWYVRDAEIGGVIIFTEDITEKYLIEEENRRLLQLQNILMQISAAFINIKDRPLDDCINDALKDIGQRLHADRIYLFDYDWVEGVSNNTHEWCGGGIEPQIEELQGLPIDMVPEWSTAHKAGQEVYIADTSEVESKPLKELLQMQGIKSLLSIPLFNDGVCIGFIGFDSVRKKYYFPDKERELLTIFADILVNVIMRLRAERELKTTKTKLEGILSEMNDVIWSLSVPGNNTAFLSPSVEKLVGKSVEECAKSAFWWQEFIHPNDRFITAQMQRGLSENDGYDAEHRIITAHNELKWVHSRGRVIRNTLGRAVRIDAVICDITKQKQHELKIESLLRDATDQNDRFRNFAHIVTHNLRSHSTNIGMLLDLWKDEHDADTKMLFTENLQNAASRLTETIEHLNEVVEMSTTTDDALRPMDLHRVVSDNLQRLTGDLAKANASATCDIDPRMCVDAVPAYLESVVHNLLSNAIKYRSAERKLALKITATELGEFCLLQVADNGLGIDLEKHGSKLFGFHKTFHGNEDARGLGLFITKNQVTAMGGRIEASSKPGVGSVFKLYLKLATGQPS